jgi:hypothetical protein
MKKLVEAGINLIAGAPYNQKLLDLCHKHGVGVFLHYVPYPVSATVEQYEDAFAAYVDHPAVWAMDVIDEPNAADLPKIGIMTKKVEELFPAGLSYINLFPNYASSAQLGSNTYVEHIEAYVEHVDTDYISYDHYMYANRNSRFLSNLQIVADACQKTGRDLWIVLEVSNTSRLLNRGEMSVQAYGALSYGTRLINWACWTAGWFEPDLQIVDSNDNYTPMYDHLKSVNHEIQRFADEYMQFERIATFALGELSGQFFDSAALPPMSWEGQNVFTSLSIDRNGAASIGYFEKKDGSEYALLVANGTDIRGNEGENTFSFRVPYALSVTATINGEKTTLTPDENGVYSVTIPFCGGSFITATRDEAAAFRAEAAMTASAAPKSRVVLNASSLGFGLHTDNGAEKAEELAELGVEFVVGQAANGAVAALADKGIGVFATDPYFRGALEKTLGISTSSPLSYSDFNAMARYLEDKPGWIVAKGTISNISRQTEVAPNGIFAIQPTFIKRSGPALSVDYAYLGALANAAHYSAANDKVLWHVIETREIPTQAIGAPTAKQLAWQIDSAFTFGAKKVIFSSFEALADDSDLLAAAKASIEHWKALAPVYNSYTYQHAYAAETSIFSAKLPLSDLEVSLASVPAIQSLSADGPVVFGLFTKENGTALMLLPGDPEAVLEENFATVTATITLSGSAKKVTAYIDGKPTVLPVKNGVVQIAMAGPMGIFITID